MSKDLEEKVMVTEEKRTAAQQKDFEINNLKEELAQAKAALDSYNKGFADLSARYDRLLTLYNITVQAYVEGR